MKGTPSLYFNRFLYFLTFLTFTILVIEYGFSLDSLTLQVFHYLQLSFALIFLLEFLFLWIREGLNLKTLRNNLAETALLILLVIMFLLYSWLINSGKIIGFLERTHHFTPQTGYLIPIQIYLSFNILLKLIGIHKSLIYLRLKPSQLVIITYLAIIIVGTLLLSLPRATVKEGVSFINRLFTATSATCVTGLTVVDISKVFSTFGQCIILLLIQIGGLGLMTFVSFFALILGKGMGMRERAVLKDVLDYEMMGRLGRLIMTMLLTTFFLEAVGAGILTLFFHHYLANPLKSFYYGIFHAVSAFCNAGFSLFTNSFQDFQDKLGFNLTITTLIILGGLGFLVIQDFMRFLYRKIKGEFVRLSLHSRLVLLTTLSLLVVGTFLFLLLEKRNILPHQPGKALLASYFQSVTARTAGFSTVDISLLREPTYLLLIFLMFIGASPGSTGGGIKTSTFAVLLFTIISYLQGKEKVEISRRTLSSFLVHKVLAIVSFSLSVVFLSTFLLLITEKLAFTQILFEVISAFGTVGLSTGITPSLSPAGKLIILATMLVGRIGPLTLALALGPRTKKVKYTYPEEKVIVG